MTALCAGGFTNCPNHVQCYLSISCSRTGAVAVPSLLPRLGPAQAGGQAPPEHPTAGSGSSRGRLLRGAATLSTVPWDRAGQCRSSQSPVPPYLRETQGRPRNGSGDQQRVPVAGAEAKPGRVRFGGGNSVSCSPATATVTR